MNTQKNKILIGIPIYKRHEIADFVLNHYSKIKETLKDEIELILLCCGSEGEASKNIARKNNFNYIEYPNLPLSQKHNALYLKAKEYNPDACLKIDSDSIMTIEFFWYYNELINMGYDYSGVEDIYFLIKKYICYWGGYVGARSGETTGVGRFMSKKLLDAMDWKPWRTADTYGSIDGELTKTINTLNKTDFKFTKTRCDIVGGMCIDLKSEVNICPFNSFIFDSVTTTNNVKIGVDFSKIEHLLQSHEINTIRVKK